MRVVIQRVKSAEVRVENEIAGEIKQGLLVLIGVGHDDTEAKAKWVADKTAVLRIFPDEQGKMNLSVEDIGGEVLVVSQFTLLGDCRKGRRPAFTDAAEPVQANKLYLEYAQCLRDRGIPVQQGIFAADMQVSLVNDGPVTLILDR
jgi:D-tyrosyl-tRNA(Tyr) deacylase